MLMKTTLILNDILVRRAKSQAALQGLTLSHFVEKCLANGLKQGMSPRVGDWIKKLPATPAGATREVDAVLKEAGFDDIDPEMWQ
jgi:hypothetical protein